MSYKTQQIFILNGTRAPLLQSNSSSLSTPTYTGPRQTVKKKKSLALDDQQDHGTDSDARTEGKRVLRVRSTAATNSRRPGPKTGDAAVEWGSASLVEHLGVASRPS